MPICPTWHSPSDTGVVRTVGKGNQPALIPLAPRISRVIDAAVDERTDRPLLARADGSRLARRAAGRVVR